MYYALLISNNGIHNSYCILIIRSLCKPGWFNDLMLKSKVVGLHQEVQKNHGEASRKAILDYLLLDPEERRRLEIQVMFEMF